MGDYVVKFLLGLNFCGVVFVGVSVDSLQPEKVIVENRSVDVSTEVVNVTEERVSPELDPSVTVESSYRHIQNPDFDTEIEKSFDSVTVNGVSDYGEIFGSSMAPGIMADDRVLVEPYNGHLELETGMVVRYRSNLSEHGFLVHRIVGDYESSDDLVLVSGDNSDVREHVSVGDVTHVVKGVVYG